MENSPLEVARSHLRFGDISAAQMLADAHLAVSPVGADDHWRFLFVKSECLRMRGRTREALDLIGSEINDNSAPDILALWKMHRGYVLGMRNSYLEAKQEFDEAERIATEHGLDQLLIEVLVRRAMILFFAEDLAASQETYRNALEMARQHGDLFLQAVALAGTGKNLMIRSNFRDAIGWYEQALAAAQLAGARVLAASMHSELGWCYYNLSEDDKALELFRLSEIVFLEVGALGNYQISLGNIGNIFVRRGDYPTAITYFQRALELAKKNDDRISMMKWLNNLSAVFSKLGNPVSAAEYRRQYTRLKTELQMERNRVRSAPTGKQSA